MRAQSSLHGHWPRGKTALKAWSETIPGMGVGGRLPRGAGFAKGIFHNQQEFSGDVVKGVRGSFSPTQGFPRAGSISREEPGRPWEPRSPGTVAENLSHEPITVNSKAYQILGQDTCFPQNSKCSRTQPHTSSGPADIGAWGGKTGFIYSGGGCLKAAAKDYCCLLYERWLRVC